MSFAKFVLALIVSFGLVLASSASGAASAQVAATASQIEPQAGGWRTWVLDAGSQLRPPPAPDAATTMSELTQLKTLVTQRDKATMDRIAFWDAGAPGYRWNSILHQEFATHGATTTSATQSRQLSLLNVAIYDAT